ncbi:MAG: cache domain-containing protein [Rubrivivax sp.]
MDLAEDLLPHMRRVQSAERDLRDLSLLWQMIEASSAISCPDEAESILPMLAQTRSRFASLQQRLLDQLGSGSVAELRDELASTAQCTVDILVRNLYERTADVGFLATDEPLRRFCAADALERDTQRGPLLQRLREYRAKYSVYDDIVLLAPDGRVLARLADSAAAQTSSDPVLAAALAGRGYAERYGRSDLGDDETPVLLYGHRVDDGAGRCVGVLVLRFRLADEMERIFASVADERRYAALVLLDGERRVVASNDNAHVPLGSRLQTAACEGLSLITFGGREYLAVTCAAAGYQGYAGPGWRAQAMVSLTTAFRSRHDSVDDSAHLTLDNGELAAIRAEVDAINADLRRVVWNGRLVAGLQGGAQARLKAVLQQINEAGSRTRDRVALAIQDLYRGSLGRATQQAQSLARLAADIMDRNLYEG